MARSLAPTPSIGCAADLARIALKKKSYCGKVGVGLKGEPGERSRANFSGAAVLARPLPPLWA